MRYFKHLELASFTISTETARFSLESSKKHWELLLLGACRLTPLQRKQIQHAIEMSTKALQQPDFPVRDSPTDVHLAKYLDALNEQILEHWSEVFKTLFDHIDLVGSMTLYQLLFTSLLLDEYQYMDKQVSLGVTDAWLDTTAGQIQQHRAAIETGDRHDDRNDDLDNYKRDVANPMQELTIDVTHAEDRILKAATGTRHPGHDLPYIDSWVYQLVQGCKWQELAHLLIHDRQLSIDLLSHEAVTEEPSGQNLTEVFPRLLQHIDDVQDTYFTTLSSVKDFKISQHAADLSSNPSSTRSSPTAPPRVQKIEKHTSAIANSIKNSLKFASGLTSRHRQDPTTSNVSSNEKTRLLPLYQNEETPAGSKVDLGEKSSLSG